MGNRSTISFDIPLNKERYPMDLTDIRQNILLKGEKKKRNTRRNKTKKREKRFGQMPMGKRQKQSPETTSEIS